MKDAEALALRNHPLLQAATFDAEAANQVTREEKSAYYPTANGSLTGAGAMPNSRIAAGYLNNPIIYNRESNGLEVNQLITDFGRTSNLVGSARLGAKAASESAQQTAQDVLLGRQSRLLRRPARRSRTQGCGGNGESAPDSCRPDHHAGEEQAAVSCWT